MEICGICFRSTIVVTEGMTPEKVLWPYRSRGECGWFKMFTVTVIGGEASYPHPYRSKQFGLSPEQDLRSILACVFSFHSILLHPPPLLRDCARISLCVCVCSRFIMATVAATMSVATVHLFEGLKSTTCFSKPIPSLVRAPLSYVAVEGVRS